MIPRRLFFIHLGPHALPPWVEENVRGWRTLLGPSWRVEVVTDASRPATAFEEVYDALPGYGAKSDVDRINVLALCGGVYLDYDVAPVRSLDPIIRSGAKFSTSFTFQGQAETAFVAMAPHHPLGTRFLAGLPGRIAAYDGTPGQFRLDYINLTVRAWDGLLDDFLAPDLRHRIQGFNLPIQSRGADGTDALLMPYQSFHLATAVPDLTAARALAADYPLALGLHEFRGTWRRGFVRANVL